MKVLVQEWLESESGWGTTHDGYSLHKTLEDTKEFIAEYWNSMPDSTPEVYSRPLGEPYWHTLTTSDRVRYQEALNQYTNGFRTWKLDVT